MILNGRGNKVALTPVGYQFPKTIGDEYDDNWLVIRGEITTDGLTWTFQDPCLLVEEAHEVGDWLDAIIDSRIAVIEAPEDWTRTDDALFFTEPLLGFSLAERTGSAITVRVHLSAEAAPPGNLEMFGYFAVIDTTTEQLRQTRETWTAELATFPTRTPRP